MELCERLTVHEHSSMGSGRIYEAWMNENGQLFEIKPKIVIRDVLMVIGIKEDFGQSLATLNFYEYETGELLHEFSRHFPLKWRDETKLRYLKRSIDSLCEELHFNIVEQREEVENAAEQSAG